MKSEKGSITIYVTIACLFVLIIGIANYVLLSNKQVAQAEMVNTIEGQYNSDVSLEETYQNYMGGEIIPIDSLENFKKIGTGEQVYIDGKVYTFGIDSTYVLQKDLTYDENCDDTIARIEENDIVVIGYEKPKVLLSTVVQPGDYIRYNPTLDVTNQSLLNYTSPVGTLKVKDGNTYLVNESGTDTFIYNKAYNLLNEWGKFVTTGYTVEADVSGNGYGEQSFTATASNNLWRVLNVTDGVIKIVPETPIRTTSSSNFYLQGLRGYKNAVTELNNISGIFGHGQGADEAESITIEDVNILTGYIVTPPTSTTLSGINKSWYMTAYNYQKGDYRGANSNIKSMIYKDSYWLASTCVFINSYGANFRVNMVTNTGVAYSNYLWIVEKNGGEKYGQNAGIYEYGVMPVVTLEEDVAKTGGDGSQGNPWTFQVTE